MIHNQSSPGPADRPTSNGHARPAILGRLQCFAAYADAPEIDEEDFPTIPIHDLSRHMAATCTVPDLRSGAIVRLFLPAIGWRHLELQGIRSGVARYRFLLPLTSHELRAAHDAAERTAPRQPPSVGPWAMTPTPLRTQPRGARPERRPLFFPASGVRTARPGLITTLARWAEAILAEPARTG